MPRCGEGERGIRCSCCNTSIWEASERGVPGAASALRGDLCLTLLSLRDAHLGRDLRCFLCHISCSRALREGGQRALVESWAKFSIFSGFHLCVIVQQPRTASSWPDTKCFKAKRTSFLLFFGCLAPSTNTWRSNPLWHFNFYLKQLGRLFQQIVLYPIIITNALLLLYLLFYKAYLDDGDKQASRNCAWQGEQRQGKENET